jgi:hypothetical protein
MTIRTMGMWVSESLTTSYVHDGMCFPSCSYPSVYLRDKSDCLLHSWETSAEVHVKLSEVQIDTMAVNGQRTGAADACIESCEEVVCNEDLPLLLQKGASSAKPLFAPHDYHDVVIVFLSTFS